MLKENRFFRYFTPRLALSVGLIALSTFNYGFDNQGIATSQAMVAYKRQFGTLDPKTGTYAIPTYFLSLLNSLNFIGFACGKTQDHTRASSRCSADMSTSFRALCRKCY
jgi:SP family sugar:H+ symporter-like MFS transporter